MAFLGKYKLEKEDAAMSNDKTMKRLEMEMAIHSLIQDMDLFIENTKQMAKIRKAKYDALLTEGFSEEQALHIVSVSKHLE